MTSLANPASAQLSDAEWQWLTPHTQQYVAASYDLLSKAAGYLTAGDLRQASEKGWGAAAQIVKAVAENWRDSGVTHGRHQDLRALVNGLSVLDAESTLIVEFRSAQDLHENFYENNSPQYRVVLDLAQTGRFIDTMLPYLRRPRPPQGLRQGQ